MFINIICGSLPSLKPLYERVVHKKPLRATKEKYYDHSGTDKSLEKSGSRSRRKYFRGNYADDINYGRETSVIALNQMDGKNHPGPGHFHVPGDNQIGVAQSYGYYYNLPGENNV